MTPAEARERAREIARDLGLQDSDYCKLRDEIAAALLSVREETIEECAGIVDDSAQRCHDHQPRAWRLPAKRLELAAAAIRALKKEA